MNILTRLPPFSHPDVTAKGEPRARVDFDHLETLWFNTGTLCNIECANCYIQSSPTNDRLVYLTTGDVSVYLDEVDALGLGPIEIGFTGGEPFLNPDMVDMTEEALKRGHKVLILTNAMRPLMRPRVQEGLLSLNERYSDQLTLRISLDHYSQSRHDEERGPGSYQATLEGMDWLSRHDFTLSAAGRTMWDEDEAQSRAGFSALFKDRGYLIDAMDPSRLILFPEMDPDDNPPEITTACWDILGVDPASIMCATSRMVVKRKGAEQPVVLSCTLIPYDENFEMAASLRDALKPIKLNHRFCAQFCVLGGASCSA